MKLKFNLKKPCALALGILLLSGCGEPNPGNSEGPEEPSDVITSEMPSPIVDETATPTEEPENTETPALTEDIDLDNYDGYRYFYETFEDCKPWNIDWTPDTLELKDIPCMAPKTMDQYQNEYGVELLLPDPVAIRAEDGTADLSVNEYFHLDCREYRADVTMAKQVENMEPSDDYFNYALEGEITVGDHTYKVRSLIYFHVDEVWDTDEFCEFVKNRITGNFDQPSRDKGQAETATYYLDGSTAGAAIVSPRTYNDAYQLSVNVSKYLTNSRMFNESTIHSVADIQCLTKVYANEDYAGGGHAGEDYNAGELRFAARTAAQFCFDMYGLGEEYENVLEGNLTQKQ